MLGSVEYGECKEVFVVWSNTDLTEGRGFEYPKHVCEIEATAVRLAQRNYIVGSNCPIKKSSAYRISSVWYAPTRIESPSPKDIKRQKEIDQQNEKVKAAEKALMKARDAGLSQKDIELIQSMFAK